MPWKRKVWVKGGAVLGRFVVDVRRRIHRAVENWKVVVKEKKPQHQTVSHLYTVYLK